MHFLKLMANRKEEPLTFIFKAMYIIHLSAMMGGGGIQYLLSDTVDELLDADILRRIK